MAFLGWLSWPLFIAVGLLCSQLHILEFGVYAGLAVNFASLAFCIWAGVASRRGPFLRELVFTLFVVGVWACLGWLALAVFRT